MSQSLSESLHFYISINQAKQMTIDGSSMNVLCVVKLVIKQDFVSNLFASVSKYDDFYDHISVIIQIQCQLIF